MADYQPVPHAEGSSKLGDEDDFGDDIPLQDRGYDDACTGSSDLDDKSEAADDVENEKPQSHPVPKWKQLGTYTNGSLIKSYCIAALPRFCQPRGLRGKGKLHPTSYLDALRGYAAFIVFIFHTFNTNDPSWRRQPFVSIIFAGTGMVALFYVISGFVLSYSLLRNIRRQQSAPTLDSLASATYRRYIRLYGSTVLAIFVALVLIRLGWYNGPYDDLYIPSLWAQIKDWLLDTTFYCNPFADIPGFYHGGVFDTKYLPTMWTIPVEFRGSIIVFSLCAAICKLSTRSRMIVCWLVICLGYYWNALYVSQFVYGVFLADRSLGRHPERLLSPAELPTTQEMPLEEESKKQSVWSKIGYCLVFILAIFLLGQPDHNDLGIWGDFPWAFLKSYIPWYYDAPSGQYWYLSMGAFLLVLSLDSYPTLHRPLEWGFSQYIGDLSFGIYALHPPLYFTFYRVWEEPMREKYLGHSPMAFIPGVLLTSLMVFVSADYFDRLDKRVVRLGKWLQGRTFRKWEN